MGFPQGTKKKCYFDETLLLVITENVKRLHHKD